MRSDPAAGKLTAPTGDDPIRFSRRVMIVLAEPRRAHFIALVTSFVALLIVGRDQWFFGDDWAILVPRADRDVLLPHVGHWNLIPALVFPFLREWFGLSSYLPFLTLALIMHLLVAHLVWRVLNRVGVSAWLATILSVLVMLYGGGAENILWAFQFGFLGAIAAGLSVMLLLDREKLNVPAVVVLAIVAPMFSGTAIPLLAGGAMVGWVRQGFLRTLLLLLPTALSYLAWYSQFHRGQSPFPTGISNFVELRNALTYSAAMYGGGIGRGLPWIGLGFVPAIAALGWFLFTVRRGLATRATLAYAMVLSSAAFVGLTTFSRMALGLDSAVVQRYAYLTLVLLIPALGLLLQKAVVRTGASRVAVISSVLLLVAFNFGQLLFYGELESTREQTSRDRIMSFVRTIEDDREKARLNDAQPDPKWSPDLRISDMAELVERRQLIAP